MEPGHNYALTAAQQLATQLLDRQAESRTLDYKASMSFGPDKAIKGKLLKCIMAFSNTRDGGHMLIGVEQRGGKFVPIGVSDSQAGSFDPTKIGDFARGFCSVLPRIRSTVVPIAGVELLLLRIEEFTDEPIVCISDLHEADGGAVLRKGQIYTRTEDAKCVAIDSSEAMRSFLDLALQKRGEGLIEQIRRLIGPAEIATQQVAADAYASELSSAMELYEREGITEPYWYLNVMPAIYQEERLETSRRVQEVRLQSEVSLRGWNFPHVDREHNHPFANGVESITHWGRYHEANRFYKSGLFSWRGRLFEEYTDQYKGALSYVSSIYTLVEFFLFASRYAPQVANAGDFIIQLGAVGLREQRLIIDNNGFRDSYQTASDSFEHQYRAPVEHLRASYRDLAADAARRLFDLYGLDISTETIGQWQNRLIEGRL